MKDDRVPGPILRCKPDGARMVADLGKDGVRREV
jgi:hypothetical protein